MCQVCRRKDKCQVYQRKDHIEGSDSRSIQRRMSIGQLGFFSLAGSPENFGLHGLQSGKA